MASLNIPGHQSVTAHVSGTLYRALQKRCLDTGESLDHIVQEALARSLDVHHHTVYQVSTSTALVQGIYQGCVTVGTIRTHGNFGLGTFDGLDGEGLMIDGCVYQALGDGSVIEPTISTLAPFWVSAEFEADRHATIRVVDDWEALCTQIDTHRSSQNLFAAIRIEGRFDTIHYRVACKAEPGTDLVTASKQQSKFTFTDLEGTLMGFWSPPYARTLNIPGYHLHFLSGDRTHGGHVLGIQARNLKLQIMDANNLVIALPESPQFLKANLSGDPSAALQEAEGTSP
jgi:acetolactate decarboxylase